MKVLKYLLVGFVFGIVLTKSEAVSGNRIYEMFQFQSFHMYGIIMVAIGTMINPDYKRKKNNGHQRNAHWKPDKEWAHIVTDWVNFRTGLGTGRFLSGTDIYRLASECSYFGANLDPIYMEFEG
jgi:hypothetical protein